MASENTCGYSRIEHENYQHNDLYNFVVYSEGAKAYAANGSPPVVLFRY